MCFEGFMCLHFIIKPMKPQCKVNPSLYICSSVVFLTSWLSGMLSWGVNMVRKGGEYTGNWIWFWHIFIHLPKFDYRDLTFKFCLVQKTLQLKIWYSLAGWKCKIQICAVYKRQTLNVMKRSIWTKITTNIIPWTNTKSTVLGATSQTPHAKLCMRDSIYKKPRTGNYKFIS